jgi:hypothetical protein
MKHGCEPEMEFDVDSFSNTDIYCWSGDEGIEACSVGLYLVPAGGQQKKTEPALFVGSDRGSGSGVLVGEQQDHGW